MCTSSRIPTVRLPLIPDHMFAGIVAKKRQGVAHIEIGDRVTVSIDGTWGRCDFCLLGETNRCIHLIRHGFERNGGMREYINVQLINRTMR